MSEGQTVPHFFLITGTFSQMTLRKACKLEGALQVVCVITITGDQTKAGTTTLVAKKT